MAVSKSSASLAARKKANAELRIRTARDPIVGYAIRVIFPQTRRAFEKGIVHDRLSLTRAFYEARFFGIEAAGLRKAEKYAQAHPVAGEIPEVRAENNGFNRSHFRAIESHRKFAATSLIIGLDRHLDAFWSELALPEGYIRGGKVIKGGVTMIELVHLCGNFIRHSHQWRKGDDRNELAERNIKRLTLAGFDYLDDDMIAKAVDALPYKTFTSIEVALLDFIDFMSWYAQERLVQDYAKWKGTTYTIPFNEYDKRVGYRELGETLNKELGSKWKLPMSPLVQKTLPKSRSPKTSAEKVYRPSRLRREHRPGSPHDS